MAKDVITRFKLETTGFDSKIKQAANELSAYSKTATQAKEGFNQFTKANVDAARALGTMATSTANAKDRAKELVGAFNDAAKAYNSLTKEQQQSDWAKALAGSLTQLQHRIKETKAEMQGLSSGGGLFSGDKLSGMLQVFGGNLMTKVAGAVANLGSEMAGMIKQGIELSRQGEGIRIAFERLGKGDLLDGLRQATHGTVTDMELMKAAVKFNDFKLPVSELGTMLAFAQQKAKDTGQSVDYMVDSIVTGLGRKSLMILDNLGLSAAEIKERMKETGDMTKAVGAIIRDQMAKSGDYIETAADRATKADVELKNAMEELGRTFQPLADAGTSMWTALETGALKFISRIGGVIAQLTEAGRVAAQYGEIGGSDRVGSQLTAYRGAKDKDSYRKAVLASYDAQIRQREQVLAGIDAWRGGDRSDANRAAFDKMERYGVGRGDNAALRAQINALRKQRDEFSRGAVETAIATTTGGGTGDNKKNTKTEQTELQQNQTKINELTQEYVKLGDESTEAARERQAEIQKEIELLKQRNGLLALRAEQAQGRFLIGAGDIQRDGLSNTPGTLLKAPETEIPKGGLQLDDKAMKAVQNNIDKQKKDVGKIGDEWSGVASAIGAVGNAMAGIEDPAAKVLGIVAQAIATVALTFSKSLAGTVTPWDWIAAAAAGTATMISTISAIHSATGYAEGGVIDSGHSPAFLSFSKSSPAFATGGIIPKFATGGVVPQVAIPIQKFAGGGMITASHAPMFISYAKSAASRFASGGTIPHANGGYFVGGTHYSSDVTPIMANAGELVLNKAQQGNLASQLQGGGMQNLNLTATIKGEQIRLALNNNGRRTGRGEYVQSRNVR